MLSIIAYVTERLRSKRQHFDWLLGLYTSGKRMP